MIGVVHSVLVFCGHYASRIRLAYLTSFLKALCTNLPIMLTVVVIDYALRNALTLPFAAVMSLAMLTLLLMQSLLQNICDRLQSATGYRVFDEKRLELGAHLKKLPMGYFTAGNTGKISSVLSNDMVFIEENSMHLVAEIMNDIFAEVIVLAFLFALHPRIGLTAALFALIAVIAAQFMNRISLKNAHNRQSSTERLSGAVLEYIEGMQVVRSFPSPGATHNGNDNPHGSGRIRAAFADNAKTNLDFEAFFTPWQTALMMLYGAGMAATLAVSVQLYSESALTAASLTGVLLFLFRIYAPLMHLYQQGTTLMIMSVCLDRIRSVFEEETIPDDGKEILTPAEETSKDIPEIRFENVSFSYDKEEVLHGITFEAMRGETVALCGPSGSGKTTIANLFARFFDVSSGTVFFRGKDIRKLPVETLMSGISMVFQKVYLFEDTVFNNIAMGRSDATLEEVKEAARRARCYDFIMKLPYGFDTVIGEGGAALSGGEAQRISIARCILKDAPVVILDEATASIDADNEHHIQAALSDLCRDKTVLVIAHRLNTIRGADRILVIDHGRIAESGTHESLLMEGGLYARMVDSADAREEKS